MALYVGTYLRAVWFGLVWLRLVGGRVGTGEHWALGGQAFFKEASEQQTGTGRGGEKLDPRQGCLGME